MTERRAHALRLVVLVALGAVLLLLSACGTKPPVQKIEITRDSVEKPTGIVLDAFTRELCKPKPFLESGSEDHVLKYVQEFNDRYDECAKKNQLKLGIIDGLTRSGAQK